MKRKNRNNPFILTGYEGPQYFCDREMELKWLVEQWDNERNMVLHSLRRMGKTALIKHFFHYLANNRKADCLYIDLLGTNDLTQAVQKLAQTIVQSHGSLKTGISGAISRLLGYIGASVTFDQFSGIPKIEFNVSNPPQPVHSLEVLGNFLSAKKEKMLLALDEFQQIVHYKDESAEAIFRSWAEEFSSVRLIFSGSHRHMMTSMFSESNRPFYRSAQLFGLDAIPSADYVQFILQQFGDNKKTIQSFHIEQILKWTRFQTYYIQVACNKLFGKTDEVKDEDLPVVFNEMIEQEAPLFSNYRLLLTNTQWEVLTAIALEEVVENPLSQTFLRKYNLGAASTVNTALQALIKKEMVIFWNNSYQLHDTLLCRWIQKN